MADRKEYQKQYYQANREKILKLQREHYQANKDAINTRSRAKYALTHTPKEKQTKPELPIVFDAESKARALAALEKWENRNKTNAHL